MKLAITGMSIADCMGMNYEQNFLNLLNDNFDNPYDHEYIKNELVERGLMRRSFLRHFDPAALNVLYTTDEAIKDADLDLDYDRDAPVIITTMRGPMHHNLMMREQQYNEKLQVELAPEEEKEAMQAKFDRGWQRNNPYRWLNTNIDFLSTHISQTYQLFGPSFQISSTCAGGLQAFEVARMYLENGKKFCIIGGYEELGTDTVSETYFSSIGAFSPTHTIRPFCENRDGTAIKDSFVSLIVEPLDLAIERGARIHVVIEDVANYNDAANALQPDKNGRGILKALDDVFERTGLDYEDIDYINAHATGTGAGDQTELNMMKAFFEEGTPISSLKGHIGHAMGSCGHSETIYTALMMKHGKIVHNANTVKPIDNYFNVLLEPIEKEIKYAVKNSFGFGGRSSTAILSKYE